MQKKKIQGLTDWIRMARLIPSSLELPKFNLVEVLRQTIRVCHIPSPFFCLGPQIETSANCRQSAALPAFARFWHLNEGFRICKRMADRT